MGCFKNEIRFRKFLTLRPGIHVPIESRKRGFADLGQGYVKSPDFLFYTGGRVTSPRTQVRMMGAPLLCPCLCSQMSEEQGLVLKCPRGTGTVLASVGCWVWNSLCQGRAPGVLLLTSANCSGFFPSWVELRSGCFRSHPAGTACMELALASPSLPRMACAALLVLGLHVGAIPGHSHLWSRRKQGLWRDFAISPRMPRISKKPPQTLSLSDHLDHGPAGTAASPTTLSPIPRQTAWGESSPVNIAAVIQAFPRFSDSQ